MAEDAVDRVFARSEPQARTVVRSLIDRVQALPGVVVDPKGTCLHLNHRTAFAGLHPRREAMLLNLRSRAPIESPRIRKVERVSANRCHNELQVDSVEAIDGELLQWIAEARALAA